MVQLGYLTAVRGELVGSAAVTFCWLLQATSGLSSCPFPSVIALAQSESRQMGAKLDIYYLRESPGTLEIFGQPSRDQTIRPRSWGKNILKEREENSTEIRKEDRGGVALNAGAILRG